MACLPVIYTHKRLTPLANCTYPPIFFLGNSTFTPHPPAHLSLHRLPQASPLFKEGRLFRFLKWFTPSIKPHRSCTYWSREALQRAVCQTTLWNASPPRLINLPGLPPCCHSGVGMVTYWWQPYIYMCIGRRTQRHSICTQNTFKQQHNLLLPKKSLHSKCCPGVYKEELANCFKWFNKIEAAILCALTWEQVTMNSLILLLTCMGMFRSVWTSFFVFY